MAKPTKSTSPAGDLAPRRLVEQGAGPDLGRTALEQELAGEGQRAAAVLDVVDQQHRLALHALRRVAHQADDARAGGAAAVARDPHELDPRRAAGPAQRPGEIGHEDEAAVEQPDQREARRKRGRDRPRQLLDAPRQLGLGEQRGDGGVGHRARPFVSHRSKRDTAPRHRQRLLAAGVSGRAVARHRSAALAVPVALPQQPIERRQGLVADMMLDALGVDPRHLLARRPASAGSA